MNRKMLIGAVALIACVVRADDPGFSLVGGLSWAGASAVSGYMQTPAGGQPGTSSAKRPTLDELGVGGVYFYDLSLGYIRGADGFYAGGQFIRMNGSGTLSSALTTHGESFPAGTGFDAKLHYDWYRAGYEHWFALLDGRFTWAPKVELALFKFDYEFRTADGSTSRGYSKPAPRIGLDGEFALSEKTALLGSVAGSVPIGSSPQIFTTDLTLLQIMYGKQAGRFGAVFAGVGMMYIDYRDNQTLENHVRLEAAPFFSVGFMAQM